MTFVQRGRLDFMLLLELRVSGNKKKTVGRQLDSYMWEQAQCYGLRPRPEITLASTVPIISSVFNAILGI